MRDGFRTRDFGANQPERVHKRKIDKVLPLLAEIPKLRFTAAFLSEADGLIADEQPSAGLVRQASGHDRLAACAPQNAGHQTRP